MEFISQHFRTPPLPVVLVHGCPEIHGKIKQFFSTITRPPLQVVIENEASSISKLFAREKIKEKSRNPAISGFIKADWIEKHRYQRAAVALVFIKYEDLCGDPTSWNKSIQLLDCIFGSIPASGIRVIIAPFASVEKNTNIELPSDRITLLRHHFNLEQKYIFPLTGELATENNEYKILSKDLKVLSQIVLESAWSFYQNQIQYISNKLNQRNSVNNDVHCWIAFKLGAISEFRQDWSFAVRQYQNAYNHLCNAHKANITESYARFVECLVVGELLNYKIFTLLMHQRRVEEAFKQFTTHLEIFKKTPREYNSGVCAFYYSWRSHQYEIAYEVAKPRIEDKSAIVPLDSVCHHAHMLRAAAEVSTKTRSLVADELKSLDKNYLEVPNFIKPGIYLGQFETTTNSKKSLSGVILGDYLLAVESGKALGEISLNLLRKAMSSYQKCGRLREVYRLGMLIAEEHIISGDLQSARKMLLQVIVSYRQDRWIYMQGCCLQKLLHISKQLNNINENIAYALELSTLDAFLDVEKRKEIAIEALENLLMDSKSVAASNFTYSLKIQDSLYSEKDSKKQTTNFNPQDAGWSEILSLKSGFKPKNKFSSFAVFSVTLKNNSPVDLPLNKITVGISDQAEYSKTINLTEGVDLGVIKSGVSFEFKQNFHPETSGDFFADRIDLFVGKAVITYSIMRKLLVNPELKLTQSLEFPSKEPIIEEPLHVTHIKHIGQIPSVKVTAPLYALVGESVPILLTISAHDQLKSCQFNISAFSTDLQCRPFLRLPSQHKPKSKEMAINEEEAKESMCAVEVPELQSGSEWNKSIDLLVENPGQVSVNTVLMLHAHCKLGRSIDIIFEPPLSFSFAFLAPPQTYLYLPEDSSSSSSTSFNSGKEEALQITDAPQIFTIPENLNILVKVVLECMSPCLININGIAVKDLLFDKALVEIIGNTYKDVVMRKGDKLAFLLKLYSSTSIPATSLANLCISWKRHGTMIVQELNSEMLVAETEINPPSKELIRHHSETLNLNIDTLLPLPLISIKKPLLSATLSSPENLVAGQSFPYSINLKNNTEFPEEFEIHVLDSENCLLAGDHDSKAYLQPQQCHQVTLQVVVHTAGRCSLPGVHIICDRMNCFVNTGGSKTLVMPAPFTS